MKPESQRVFAFLAATTTISAVTLTAPYMSLKSVLTYLGIAAFTGSIAIPTALWDRLNPEIQSGFSKACIAPIVHIGMRLFFEASNVDLPALASGALIGFGASICMLEARDFTSILAISSLLFTSSLAATFSQTANLIDPLSEQVISSTIGTAAAFVSAFIGGAALTTLPNLLAPNHA